MENYYDVLVVAKDASSRDIKKQFRKLARKFHPDRSEEKNATEKFQKINSAYQTLKDPKKRAAYDNPQSETHGFSFRTSPTGGFADLGELLREMQGSGWQRQQYQPMAQVTISLEEAFTGTTRILNHKEFNIPAGIRSNNQLFVDGFIIIVNVTRHHKFQRSHDDLLTLVEISAIEAMLGIECKLTCIDDTILKFDIPAGMQHGKIIRLSGKGMPNPEINIRGDLLVQVKISIPENLTSAERDSIISVNHRKQFRA